MELLLVYGFVVPKTLSSLISALCVTLLFLSACSSKEEDTEQAQTVDVDAPTVTVLDQGQAPYEPLVWFTDSEEQVLTYKATRGFSQKTIQDSVEKSDQAIPYSSTTMTLPLTTTSKTDGESISNTYTLGVPQGSNTELNSDLSTAEGFEISSSHALNGKTTERKYTPPAEASDTARANIEDALNQMFSLPLIFPDEPLGAQARWSVTQRVVEGQVSYTQKTTYDLIERQNSTISLSVSMERTPTLSVLPGSVEELGHELRIVDTRSQSEGGLQIDLRKALPIQGSIDLRTTVTYRGQAPQKTDENSTPLPPSSTPSADNSALNQDLSIQDLSIVQENHTHSEWTTATR